MLTWSIAYLSLLSLRLAAAALPSGASCWYSGGDSAGGDEPCFPDRDVSPCCGSGQICTNEGLCAPSTAASDLIYHLTRGSCTDKSWTSTLCAQYCTNGYDGGSNFGANLVSCQNSTGNDRDYCCEDSDDCCNSGAGRFRLAAEETAYATLAATGAVQLVVSESIVATSSTITTSSSATVTSGSASSTTTQPPSTSSSSTSSSSLSVVTEGLTQPTASSATTPSYGSDTLSKYTIAGIVSGAVIFVVILPSLTILLYFRNKWRKERARQNRTSFQKKRGEGEGQDLLELHEQQRPMEVGGQNIVELHGQQKPIELAGGNDVIELEGRSLPKWR